jgi:tellurite resistance protein
MATIFKNKVVKDVGALPIVAIETDSATRATIIGLSLANLTDNVVNASVLVSDDTSVTGYFMKEVMVPANTSLRALSAGEKLILAPTNQLLIQADQDEALDAVISYVDIV